MRRLLGTLLLAAALLAPAGAHANQQQISIMQDDDLLVYRDAPTRDATLNRMKALGVDYVRVTVLWEVAAQDVMSTPARRKRFRGNVPATYPHRNWDKYDDLVRAAGRRGIGVYFSVTGPGPSFAHEKAPASQRRNVRTWKPKAGEFAKFVAALGKRYSGTYRDENQGRGALPRVAFWGLWNEPNQGGWLTPQYATAPGGRAPIPMSPIIYRRLFLYGRKALQGTGHGKDLILLGETAPIGNAKRTSRSPMRPAKFLRELLCVDANGRRYTGAAAKQRDCAIFKRLGPLRPTAYGHHPYTKDIAPTRRDPSRDSLTMANINDLPTLLDRLATTTGNVPKGLPVFLTEFGYETNPPDPFSGQSLANQAAYIIQGDFLAWRNPRVYSQTQFILRDVAPVKRFRKGTKPYWFTYQSGLYFNNNVPKPSAQAYTLPFVATATPGGVGVWGQLRFRPNGVTTDTVQIEFSANGGATFAPVGLPLVVRNGLGFFNGVVPSQGPGLYRARWTGQQLPFNAASRPARVG